MPWYEREQSTPFDQSAIAGLSFLHGDLMARQYQEDWVRGKKFPLITFPTGTTRELLPQEPAANIWLFGDVFLPYNVTRREAFQLFTSESHKTRLHIVSINDDGFVVLNRYSRRGYGLYFDSESGELANMNSVPHEAVELLPGELRAVLPKLYSTEKSGDDAVAPMKFFTPDANWTWYPTEFDGNDLFFGLVSGFELEIGYFSLAELEEVRGGLNLPIERDLYFSPKTLRELKAYHRG